MRTTARGLIGGPCAPRRGPQPGLPAWAGALQRSPIALGIGANSALFSAIDAVLLKPLPYPAADRLVAVYETNASQKELTSLVAPVRLEE